MKHMKKMALLVLALAVSGGVSAQKKVKLTSQQIQDTIVSNIMTRTSIRAFTQDSVTSEQIETLLRAGMAAPTAVNKQPWHFVVVNQPDVLAGLTRSNPNASAASRAPLAIVVCGDLTKALKGTAREFWVQDASAATENILLAANALGLGAVWTGTYPDMGRVESVRRLLNLPETMVPLNTICIGHPLQPGKPKDKFKQENISYNIYKGDENTVNKLANRTDVKFRDFDVRKEFNGDPFSYFMGNGSGLLMCVPSKSTTKSNAMTIGWGALGTLWNMGDVVTVYVSKDRYTHQLLDEGAKYFTVMAFNKEKSKILQYMGTVSGRDVEKALKLGLHTAYTENGTPYYEEASMVLECEIIYSDDLKLDKMSPEVRKFYADGRGVHTLYMGRIVKAMKK